MFIQTRRHDINISWGDISVIKRAGPPGVNLRDWGTGSFINISDWAKQFSFMGRTPILENIYDVIATEFSKIDLVLSRETETENPDGTKQVTYVNLENHPNNRALALRPNSYQTKSELLYTIAYQLHCYRNALVRIVRDVTIDRNIVLELEPLDCGKYLFGQGYDVGGTLFLKLKERETGNIILLDYDDIIHLRLNPNDMFYGDKSEGGDLTHFVKIFDENLSAMLRELKDSGALRGVVEIGASVSKGGFNGAFIGNQDKVDKSREISERIKQSNNGIIVLDSGEKWTSLTRTFRTMPAQEVDNFMQYLYSFKGINRAVIDGTATEAQMGVFFNKTIAPMLMRFIEELNYKYLTPTARTQGQKIEYFKNPFEYASMKDLLRNLYLGAMFFTKNEIRRMAFKMPPKPGGDDLEENKNFTRIVTDEGGEANGDN